MVTAKKPGPGTPPKQRARSAPAKGAGVPGHAKTALKPEAAQKTGKTGAPKSGKASPCASGGAPKDVAQRGARVDGLLPKQAAFVAQYLIDGNATQAAIRAGYSPKTAYSIGQENLKKPEIAAKLAQKQSVIAARQDEQLEAMELTEERVMRETARLAFFDPRKMFAADGRPLAITELDADTAACIVGLDVLEEFSGTGKDRVLIGHVKKYKIADKNSALDRAAKILGMFKKDNEQPGAGVANAIGDLIKSMGRSSLPVISNPEE